VNTETKLRKARAGLVLDAPFWGALLGRLNVQADPSAETGWTDGRTLAYSPAFIDTLTPAQTRGFLAHEVAHCAFQHHTRRGGRDSQTWNVATDYAINAILTAEGFDLPPGALVDARFQGMSAEQIFGALQQDDQGQGQGDDQGQGDQGQGDDQGQGEPGAGTPDPGACGEVRDAPAGVDEYEAEQEWRDAVQEAQDYAARACGGLSGGLGRAVQNVLDPVIDWRERLRDFIEQTAKQDYTWARPNRRHVHAGLYLPGCESEELPPIAICVDTSGSINTDALAQFSGEVQALLADFPGSMARVIYCDDQVRREHYATAEDCDLTDAPGGGGTAFSPALVAVEDWTAETGISPACVIYFTDLICWDWGTEPEAPVMWLQWRDHGTDHYANNPPFGEVVKM